MEVEEGDVYSKETHFSYTRVLRGPGDCVDRLLLPKSVQVRSRVRGRHLPHPPTMVLFVSVLSTPDDTLETPRGLSTDDRRGLRRTGLGSTTLEESGRLRRRT